MHSAGVAHRDLKLENVLFHRPRNSASEYPTIKVCDFGLAHKHSLHPSGNGFQMEALTQFCGSRSYCAPELNASLPYNGFKADVYSLGVCLFALCTGFFPMEEASHRDWRLQKLQIAQSKGESLVQACFSFYKRKCPLSMELVSLLDGMLNLDPKQRYSIDDVKGSRWLNKLSQRMCSVPAVRQVGYELQNSRDISASNKHGAYGNSLDALTDKVNAINVKDEQILAQMTADEIDFSSDTERTYRSFPSAKEIQDIDIPVLDRFTYPSGDVGNLYSEDRMHAPLCTVHRQIRRDVFLR